MGDKEKVAMRFLACILTGLFAFYFYTSPVSAEKPGSISYWPTDTWKTASPESQGMRSEQLADMMNLVWKNGLAIDSISIVRNGYLVLDAYNHRRSKDSSRIIYSCTKSIVSTLVGIAIDKGYIKGVDQPVLAFFPEKKFKNLTDDKKKMTLEHVLTMATGLDCQDSYIYNWSGLYDMVSSEDWVQFLLDLPMISPPGSSFEYCNGASFLLSAIIQKSTGVTSYEFAKKHLFNPLGITQITWPENRQGITIGYSEIRMKPHDMAKIGYLYLNNGVWDKKQIVSSEWVHRSTRTHIPATLLSGYGYQWWIANPGLYTAVGYQGQFIMVQPEKKMVIVFTSSLDNSNFSTPLELVSNYILPAVTSENPLQEDSRDISALQAIVKKWQTIPYDAYKKGNQEASAERKEEIVKEYINEELGLSISYNIKQFNIEAAIIPPAIYRRKNVKGLPAFAVLTDNLPQGLTLDSAEKYTIDLIRKFPSASDFKVIKKEMVTLENGTKAGYSELNWRYQSLNLVTVSVFTINNDKLVGVIVSNTRDTPIEFLSKMAKSLKFKNKSGSR